MNSVFKYHYLLSKHKQVTFTNIYYLFDKNMGIHKNQIMTMYVSWQVTHSLYVDSIGFVLKVRHITIPNLF